MKSSGLVVSALILSQILVTSAAAEEPQPLPSSVTLLPVSAESYPFNGAAHQVEPIDLGAYNYVEEEFLVSGIAQIYDWQANGDFDLSVLGSSDYTTRIMVRRPADMSRFSGRVVMEVVNMSADYDWTAMWAALWERVIANGDVYVGITSKPNIIPGLQRFDPARYASLAMPSARLEQDLNCSLPQDGITYRGLTAETESGLAWDIFTQIGRLLKTNEELNPLGVPADRVFFTGESQSGNYALTYFKFFQPTATVERAGVAEPIYDAFLLEAPTTPAGVPIRQCAEALPEDDPQLVSIPGRGVPLAMINSQWDFFPASGGQRKPDSNTATDMSVTWELAGSHHGWRFQYLFGDANHEDLRRAGHLEEDWSAWTCGSRSPEVPLYMAEKALYEHLIDWVDHGISPPSSDPIELTEDGRVAFDEHGIALGGLRLPMVAVPVASYGDGLYALTDGCPEIVPFSDEKIRELYATREIYLEAYHRATWQLVQDGFLLSEDARALISIAQSVPFN